MYTLELSHSTERGSVIEDIHQCFALDEIPASKCPCRPIVPKTTQSDMLRAIFPDVPVGQAPEMAPCPVEWTTCSGVARELLNFLNIVLINWIGVEYCPGLLAFAYAFAVSPSAFQLAWLHGCIGHAVLMVCSSIGLRPTRLRGVPRQM